MKRLSRLGLSLGIVTMLVMTAACRRGNDGDGAAKSSNEVGAPTSSESGSTMVPNASGGNQSTLGQATVVGVVDEDWALAGEPTPIMATYLRLLDAVGVEISRLDGGHWLPIATDAAVVAARLQVHLATGSYLISWQTPTGRLVRGFALVSAAQAASQAEIIVRLGVTSEMAARILEQIPTLPLGEAALAAGQISEAILMRLGSAVAHAAEPVPPEAFATLAATVLNLAPAVAAAQLSEPSAAARLDPRVKTGVLYQMGLASDSLFADHLVEIAASLPVVVRGAAIGIRADLVPMLTVEGLGALRAAFASAPLEKAIELARDTAAAKAEAPAVLEIVATPTAAGGPGADADDDDDAAEAQVEPPGPVPEPASLDPAATDPSLLAFDATASTTAVVTWQPGAKTSKTLVAYRTDGALPAAGCATGADVIVAESAADALSLTNLDGDKSYLIRACGVTQRDGLPLPGAVTSGRTHVLSHRMFLGTPRAISPQLGVAKWHQHCQAEATAAGMGGTWRAIVASSDRDARDIVSMHGPIFDNAASPSQLWNGPLTYWLDSPPSFEQRLADRASVGAVPIWTGLRPDEGDGVSRAPLDHCGDFLDDALTGQTMTSLETFDKATTASCDQLYFVRCIDGQAPLVAPAHLYAQGLSDTSIEVTWNDVDLAATSHEIQRSESPTSAWRTIGYESAAATAHGDGTVTAGVTYYYRVRSHGAAGQSEFTYPAKGIARSSHRMFATSKAHPLNLGNGVDLSAYDAICQEHATAAHIGGSWKALLSMPGQDAKTRLTIVGRIFNLRRARLDGSERIATSAADLWDGSIEHAVGYDENGHPSGNVPLVTGTALDGSVGTDHCSGFTDSGAQSIRGNPRAASQEWLVSSPNPCTDAHFFCVDRQ